MIFDWAVFHRSCRSLFLHIQLVVVPDLSKFLQWFSKYELLLWIGRWVFPLYSDLRRTEPCLQINLLLVPRTVIVHLPLLQRFQRVFHGILSWKSECNVFCTLGVAFLQPCQRLSVNICSTTLCFAVSPIDQSQLTKKS